MGEEENALTTNVNVPVMGIAQIVKLAIVEIVDRKLNLDAWIALLADSTFSILSFKCCKSSMSSIAFAIAFKTCNAGVFRWGKSWRNSVISVIPPCIPHAP